jgi:DNA polymerase elongation subunit (family B)
MSLLKLIIYMQVSVLEGGYGANPPPVGGHQRLAAAGRTSANKGDVCYLRIIVSDILYNICILL